MKNKFVIRVISSVIKKNIFIDFLLLLTVFGVIIVSLIPPQLLKLIIDNYLVPKNSNGLILIAAAYMGVLLFIGIFDFLKEAVLTVLGQKITKEIRHEMMLKLQRINAQFFSVNESGTVVSKFTNDVDAINSLFTSGIVGMAIDLFKIIGIIISVGFFSPKLCILTVILLPIVFFITRLFQKRMLASQIKNRFLIGKVNNHITESLKNIQMIKSFSKEKYMEGRYKGYLEENFATVEKINFYDSVFSPIITVIRAIVIAVIVILSSSQLKLLGISLGMVAASIELISNLFGPIDNLGMELQNIQQAVSGIRRVNEFIAETEDKNKNYAIKAENILSGSKNAGLSFDDVSFYYEEGQDILQDINLSFAPQEKATFIGRTGVGKSTLFRLILGLMKPTKGRITLNGTDVYDIPNSEKRKLFGYVNQDFNLIKGTVADQISLQDSNISREKVIDTLNFVGLADSVKSFKNGLDTQVSNDKLFSQGQIQLLAIARAIVTNPPVLLLDEVTANLDSITEEKITAVLRKVSKDHMILSISHRLSSLIASDTIIILENGRVKNSGAPETLMKNDEWYRNRLILEKLTWD